MDSYYVHPRVRARYGPGGPDMRHPGVRAQVRAETKAMLAQDRVDAAVAERDAIVAAAVPGGMHPTVFRDRPNIRNPRVRADAYRRSALAFEREGNRRAAARAWAGRDDALVASGARRAPMIVETPMRDMSDEHALVVRTLVASGKRENLDAAYRLLDHVGRRRRIEALVASVHGSREGMELSIQRRANAERAARVAEARDRAASNVERRRRARLPVAPGRVIGGYVLDGRPVTVG